jgi:hypothetical protein
MPLENLKKYSELFIETGTHLGEGVHKALNSGYSRVISIELDDKYYQHSAAIFNSYSNVKIIKGDSAIILQDILKTVNEQATFWLDGHYSGGDTAWGKYQFPIMAELEQIKNHHINSHTILIDDIRCWKSFDEHLYLDLVINYVKSINESYAFYTVAGCQENDILVCVIE